MIKNKINFCLFESLCFITQSVFNAKIRFLIRFATFLLKKRNILLAKQNSKNKCKLLSLTL